MPRLRAALAAYAPLCVFPLILIALLMLLRFASGRERWAGQYDAVDPHIREWFRSQKSPQTGQLCCNEADGVYVQEDIRNGHYWAKGGPFTEFVPVPDEVVIRSGNRNGAPVLWSFYQDGIPQIRCFAPGALL